MDFPAQTRVFPPPTAGGTSYDPLVKSSDPAAVPLTSGTTSSSASARTFTAPTDGSGSYTLSVALVQDVGTGAVLAGDNSSGWYATTLEDGDVCRIVGTWEDDTTAETVQNTFVVAVAAAGGIGSSGSELLLDIDFSTADAATLSGSGNITEDSGATVVAPYVVWTQTGSVSSESYEITGGALAITRDTGNSVGGISFGIASALSACDPARDKLLILVKFTSISSTAATNQNITVSLGDVSNNISNNPNRGVMLAVTAAGTDVDINLRQYTSGVTTVKLADYGTAMPTSGNALLEVDLDRVRGGWTDLAAPDRSDVTVGTIGGSSESPSASLGSAPWTHILLAINPQTSGTLVLSIASVQVYRTTQGAS